MPVVLGLLSSLLWGTSDFLGGTLSRRLPVRTVLLASQGVALLLLVPVALLTGGPRVPPDYLLAAAAAGLTGMVALGAFFRALARGTMGVVAPVAALSVAVPVALGLARGESPSAAQLAGMALAVAGVVLACGPELGTASSGRGGRPVLLLALVAALGFGIVVALVAEASRGAGPGTGRVVMVLLTMRAASVTAITLALLVRRTPLGAVAADTPSLAGVGVMDAAANGCFALASRGGLISVVAVLGSLYPVVTLLLARRFHGERLARGQLAGVACAVLGVGLLSAG